MNYFGHAVIATALTTDGAAVFGSMVPDFAGMVRARQPRTEHELLGSGIRLHHRTDAVFHGAAAFVRLEASAREALQGLGIRRGPALATAHIGTELLLDGWLGQDARHRSVYTEAIDTGIALLPSLAFHSPEDAERFSVLLHFLAARGIDADSFTPPAVARRVERALRDRPRLALSPEEAEQVEGWAERARPTIEAVAPDLLAAVHDALDDAPLPLASGPRAQ